MIYVMSIALAYGTPRIKRTLPCIGQNIDNDYDHDHDNEGRAEQIVIVVVVLSTVATHDINITTGRRATGLPALLAQRR
ncbi:MAG: hypothetical protein ACOC43_17050, partial [Desulfohalobiaceae bacterium]